MFRQRSETGVELQQPVPHLCSIYNRFDTSSTESALDPGSQRIYQYCLPRRICHLFSVCPSSAWTLIKGRAMGTLGKEADMQADLHEKIAYPRYRMRKQLWKPVTYVLVGNFVGCFYVGRPLPTSLAYTSPRTLHIRGYFRT